MCAIRNYSVVTLAYWSFMLTDGALRMIVLLHFHKLGYTPLELAFLFLLYEFFGIVTNLFAGYIATIRGLKITLIMGLFIQACALMILSYLEPEWKEWQVIGFIMLAQSLSGIAKDLTKMSSKTAIKFLIPENDHSSLFKWVSVLTGSKNAIKGAGFFVGGILLSLFGFQGSLWILASIILTAFLASLLLPNQIGKVKQVDAIGGLFQQNQKIKCLSLARFFLFGARDIWFVVAVPLFFSIEFQWNFSQIGSFMAVWVMGYGFFQSIAPVVMRFIKRGKNVHGRDTIWIGSLLLLVLLFLVYATLDELVLRISLPVGLVAFGIVFALMSSVHSYLVLKYSDGDKAAKNVGFYYMSNAAGRLVGTLFSGLLYQEGGLLYCLLGSSLFIATVILISCKLPPEDCNNQ